MADPVWWMAALGALGLVFGSFIATVAIRWPEGRSALKGRSECDGCGRTLTVAELIPVGSYVAQRGRCRACGAAIGRLHPVVELLGLATGLVAAAVAPDWTGVAGAIFGWLLLTLAVLDLRAFWLPDLLTGALALAGLTTGLLGLAPSTQDRLIGGIAGFAVLWAVAALYRNLRGREGLGGGDAKLMGAIGLWLGWRDLPLVLFTACMIGLVAALVILARRGRLSATDQLPLGMLLALAAFPCWLTQAIR
ncbi:prepilin peptidase [Stakelama saccharophila]|uniref:Prepilin leader peptidase/N-methyltransferase n=1 Tax=Stakelama saccharophila TaxID=3075605 RepID=A0ABZ0B6U1_9SPHN|nr:prepilin peptidase [Stakelama sp. W311]WNO52932.1 prepilin peptidase [Stakelama sp. W311]